LLERRATNTFATSRAVSTFTSFISLSLTTGTIDIQRAVHVHALAGRDRHALAAVARLVVDVVRLDALMAGETLAPACTAASVLVMAPPVRVARPSTCTSKPPSPARMALCSPKLA
jgi:hypothetical protein